MFKNPEREGWGGVKHETAAAKKGPGLVIGMTNSVSNRIGQLAMVYKQIPDFMECQHTSMSFCNSLARGKMKGSTAGCLDRL